MKKIFFILLIALNSCKTSKFSLDKTNNIVLPAYNISNSGLNSVMESIEKKKNIIVVFQNKHYPLKKLDSIVKSIKSEYTLEIKKDTISRKEFILINKVEK